MVPVRKALSKSLGRGFNMTGFVIRKKKAIIIVAKRNLKNNICIVLRWLLYPIFIKIAKVAKLSADIKEKDIPLVSVLSIIKYLVKANFH